MDDQHEPDHTKAPSHRDRERGGNGRFTRSIETAERDAEAARLRARGLSYPRIAEQLGYADHTGAYYAVQRALKAAVQEPAEEVRQLERERLDYLWQQALAVLETEHVHVSGGNVVTVYETDENGNLIVLDRDADDRPIFKEKPILDDGPKLKAIETLLKIQARRAALDGLDAPVKADIGGKLSYEIIGVDPELL
ncbi:hypothetical protein [Actinomadura sp. 21ATH]|uniref:hypothetical protein n=1 Tax=Actinomadura sp. 21ATH TaxID=1735444 RepID=UPI0035C22930